MPAIRLAVLRTPGLPRGRPSSQAELASPSRLAPQDPDPRPHVPTSTLPAHGQAQVKSREGWFIPITGESFSFFLFSTPNLNV